MEASYGIALQTPSALRCAPDRTPSCFCNLRSVEFLLSASNVSVFVRPQRMALTE